MPPRAAALAPTAAAWLRAELSYIADRDPAAARKIAARTRRARRLLAEYPKTGPIGVVPDTRRLVVPPYILTVRQTPHGVLITAVRHARQADAYAPDIGADY